MFCYKVVSSATRQRVSFSCMSQFAGASDDQINLDDKDAVCEVASGVFTLFSADTPDQGVRQKAALPI